MKPHPPPPLDGVGAERGTGLLSRGSGYYHTATLTSTIHCTQLHYRKGRETGGEEEEGRKGEVGEERARMEEEGGKRGGGREERRRG